MSKYYLGPWLDPDKSIEVPREVYLIAEKEAGFINWKKGPIATVCFIGRTKEGIELRGWVDHGKETN